MSKLYITFVFAVRVQQSPFLLRKLDTAMVKTGTFISKTDMGHPKPFVDTC